MVRQIRLLNNAIYTMLVFNLVQVPDAYDVYVSRDTNKLQYQAKINKTRIDGTTHLSASVLVLGICSHLIHTLSNKSLQYISFRKCIYIQ